MLDTLCLMYRCTERNTLSIVTSPTLMNFVTIVLSHSYIDRFRPMNGALMPS